ncbi:MAG: GNAT family N-acetyltransferase [Gammaproteobacteria bacterium]
MPKLSPEFYTDTFWQQRLNDFHATQNANAYRYVIMHQHEVIGHLFIDNVIRGPFQAAYVGYAIAKAYEGKGLVSSALKHITEHVFKEAKLNRLMANCMPSNYRSIRVLNTLDFRMEGLAKRYLKIKGQWEDHFLFSKLNPYFDE